jgi:pyruvate formate lyase activating enzyme
MVTRRNFLQTAAFTLPALASLGPVVKNRLLQPFLPGTLTALGATPLDEIIRHAPKARYWTTVSMAGANCLQCHSSQEQLQGKTPNHSAGLVKCLLCAQGCVIKPGQRGTCRTRMNVGGQLRSLVYGRPMSWHVDPIEKKPFYHFLPGSDAYSLCTSGCPFHCRFCQNWQISQASPEDYEPAVVLPRDVSAAAQRQKAPIIAFTYNEPTVCAEYVTDIARAAKDSGQRSALISCGFMNEAPLTEMCDVLDAIKIDLKGYSDTFYETVCSARLQPVLRSIKQIRSRGTHLELVNLVVPTLNDSEKMLQELTDWVIKELGPDVPLHFTRFQPNYQLLNLPPTPVATLEHARAVALSKGIHYAYVGNVPNHPGNHTYCPKCKNVVIRRNGFFVTDLKITGGRCAICQCPIAGVWA